VISCTAQRFSGPIAFTVADPTIASVELAQGTFTLFYVAGLQPGTTTASFQSQSGGTGQAIIDVVP
jgi:Flp pilus assembly secretin CpaC